MVMRSEYNMHSKVTVLVAFILSLSCSGAQAAYTRYMSSAVTIQTIYSNEMGSPFVVVTPTVNATCAGLYLYDITSASPELELRRNKMAVLLTAARCRQAGYARLLLRPRRSRLGFVLHPGNSDRELNSSRPNALQENLICGSAVVKALTLRARSSSLIFNNDDHGLGESDMNTTACRR